MKTFLIHADGQLFKFHNTHFYRYKIRLPFVAFTVTPIRDYGYVTNDALTHTHIPTCFCRNANGNETRQE
jgi:hypothetical protein